MEEKVTGFNCGYDHKKHTWDGSYELKLSCGHSVWVMGIKGAPKTWQCPECIQERWLDRLFNRRKK